MSLTTRFRSPDDALVIAKRARALRLSTTVGIIHDHSGQLLPLDAGHRSIVEEIVGMGESALDFANYNRFQKNLASGRPNDCHCRAGARYLYVCEDGLVHWCSQQRGHPGIPLAQYGRDDLEREYHLEKACARSARSIVSIEWRKWTNCVRPRFARLLIGSRQHRDASAEICRSLFARLPGCL